MTDEPEVLFEQEGFLGRITLNRPKAINALTHTMARQMDEALRRWENDDSIRAVVVIGAGDRGLCAGGDIRSIYDDTKAGGTATDDFWADEYRLDLLIDEYPKPYIAIMDGLVMGGGVGISAHGSHRIVTERSKIAMPEVGIGFVPDVGGTFILSRSVGCYGIHAAITAMQMCATDAIANGFADHYIPIADIEPFLARVAEDGDVDAALQTAEGTPEPGELQSIDAELGSCYEASTVAEVVRRLDDMDGELASSTAKAIRGMSPISVEVALSSIKRAKEFGSLAEALNQEYRVSTYSLRHGDFIEGIRAQIIDKDRQPKWNPPTLDEVRQEMIDAYFAPIGERELNLSTTSGA